MPRPNNSLSRFDHRELIALWSFETADFYCKNVLCRSVSLEEMKEDLDKFKKAIGWRERPVYAY